MTGDYKDKLFQYLFGTLPYVPGDNEIQLENTIDLYEVEGENKRVGQQYLLKDNNGVENGLILEVHNIEDPETGNNVSYLTIKDIKNGDTSYIEYTTSGVQLPQIDAMYIEDDGTIFLKTADQSTNFPYRIMMINNISNKVNNTYVFKIRKSYDIGDGFNTAFYVQKIYKSLTEAKYLLVGYELRDSGNSKLFELLECTINVGSENEYKLSSSNKKTGNPFLYSTYCKWNSDGEFKLKILLADSNNYITELVKDYGDESTNLTDNFNKASSDVANRRLIYTTYDNLIMGIHYISSSRELYTNVMFISGNNVNIYDDELIDTYSSSNIPDIQDFSSYNVVGDYLYMPITKNDGKTYMYIYQAESSIGSWAVNRVCDNEITTYGNYGVHPIIVNKQYDLTNLYSFINVGSGIENFCYHINNQFVLYSSEMVGGLDFIQPKLGILKDNTQILFARELYNLIRQQNTLTSTINVPNQMLNDNTIKKEQLIAYNNGIIDSVDEDIVKNVYENVLINFNDTYTIINKNNNMNLINTEAAVGILKDWVNMFNLDPTAGYNKIPDKFRIVYQDDTTEVGYLPTPTLDNDNRIAEYYLVISSIKPINRVEFISEDELTTFIIITLNIEANKIYKIRQRVRVR